MLQAITSKTKFASATFAMREQHLEQVQAAVAQIVGRGGCTRCGLIAFLTVQFQGDPPPSLGKEGVISYVEQGLNAS